VLGHCIGRYRCNAFSPGRTHQAKAQPEGDSNGARAACRKEEERNALLERSVLRQGLWAEDDSSLWRGRRVLKLILNVHHNVSA